MAVNKVVLALDYADEQLALRLVEQLDPTQCRLKIGKEMFTRFGPALVEKVQQKGFDVFLDLKFHDIPNTVAKACQAAADLGVWMVNVHASGGEKMLSAAVDALQGYQQKPILTAVTVLTSMDQAQLSGLGIERPVAQQVLHLAGMAQRCGVDGVVCSAQEATLLRANLSRDFVLITPGIRPQGADVGDQIRIMTPSEAIQVGVDYLVIGRPVTQAADPSAALAAINQEIALALQ